MTPVKRRTLITGAAAAGVVAAVGIGRSRQSEPSGPPASSPASSPTDSTVEFGVNIHSPFVHSPYADHGAVYDAVLATGASWVRDNLAPGVQPFEKQLRLWRRLHGSGVAITAIVGGPDYGPDRRGEFTANLDAAADVLTRVEGWNEPEGSADWFPRTVDHQQWLWNTIRTDPALTGLDVLGPSLKWPPPATFQERIRGLYGQLDGRYDFLSFHCYPIGGETIDQTLDTRLELLPPRSPVIITEGGFDTGIGGGLPGRHVDEATQARMLVDYVRQAAKHGCDLAIYQLLDDLDSVPPSRQGAHFGLYRCPGLAASSWRPKAAVSALAALARGEA
jgi:hypothetical protein